MNANTLSLWQIWQSLENGLLYRVICLDDQEIVATTAVRQTDRDDDSFIWLSEFPEFLSKFKFVKMGPTPPGA